MVVVVVVGEFFPPISVPVAADEREGTQLSPNSARQVQCAAERDREIDR